MLVLSRKNREAVVVGGGGGFPGLIKVTVLEASSVKISQTSVSGHDFVAQIPSVAGHTYQLQFSPSLKPANWMNTGASASGTGSVLMLTDSGATTNSATRFYRVLVAGISNP